jgi:hypothetical protein
MRGKALVVLILLLLGSLFGVFPAAGQTPKVSVDGREVYFDVPPVIEKGRVLMPLRGVFEAMDAGVEWAPREWDPYRKTYAGRVRVFKSYRFMDLYRHIELWVGGSKAYILELPQGQNYTKVLDIPPRIISGRTLVPLRFVSEALLADVQWLSEQQQVVITSYEAKVARSAGIQAPTTAPNLRGESFSTSLGKGIKLSWTPVTNAQGYRIYVGYWDPSSREWSNYRPYVNLKENSYSEYGYEISRWLNQETSKFCFYVTAVNLAGEGPASNVVFLDASQSQAPIAQAPAAPTGLRVVAYEVTPAPPVRVTLSWNAVANATRYKLYSSLYFDGTWSQWQLYTTIPDNSFTISIAGPSEAAVAFYVTAENEAGESPASNVLNLANDAHLQELLANLHLQGLQPEGTASVVPADYYTSFGPFYHNTLNELVQYLRIPVNLPAYEAHVLDCSEAAAMMEWRLQNAGFDAYIAVGQMYGGYHAWVIAKCRDGTVAIEATRWYAPTLWQAINRMVENLNLFDWLWDYGPGITRVDEKYFKYEDLSDDISGAIGKYSLEEWDWWNELHRRGMCTCIPSVDQGGCSGG